MSEDTAGQALVKTPQPICMCGRVFVCEPCRIIQNNIHEWTEAFLYNVELIKGLNK